jgi:hypothetical protein
MKKSEPKFIALNILISEFTNMKYGQFVKKQIEELESGVKDRIGYQSEGGEVILDISISGCTITYDYWDNNLGDTVKGKDVLQYETVIKMIREIIE